ncbi:FAD-dependent oxidoreductase [Microbulbifer variabilis]|uniref:FAD-dependent oxidoreductase n=1 Tax=Microbulbifer variabilis TaxID=266805 RepID=UPI0003824C5C|nr:FAD-dependent oxidoreductase [Microbulbifer variabilis]
MSQTIPVDVLILGGGIQGVTLIRQLIPEYSVILVDDELGDAESLHFHGYFSSGWNAANPQAAEIYRTAAQHWHKELANSGVNSRITDFHAALTPDFLKTVEGNWAGAAIPSEEVELPEIFDPDGLPPNRRFRFPDDLVFDGAAAYLSVSEPMRKHIYSGRLASFQLAGSAIEQVALDIGGRSCEVRPELVISACGAGNAEVIRQLGVAEEQVQNAQLVRPLHMLLARGPNIPPVSAFLIDLIVMYHPLEGGEGLWILTLNPEVPKFKAGVVDMRIPPEIENDLLCASFKRLSSAMVAFEAWAQGCQWSVYAGWKTDAPGPDGDLLVQLEYPTPYQLDDFGLQNFLAVWPNHWGLAANVAEDAGKWVRTKLKSCHPQPGADSGLPPGPGIGHPIENRWQSQELNWQSWEDFARKVGYHD